MKNIITGIRATGIPHIGNYVGSIRPIINMQESYNIYQVIADVHAIPIVRNAEELRSNVYSILACYLACGLEPEKTTIWKQSQSDKTAWVFAVMLSLTNMAELKQIDGYEDDDKKDLLSCMYNLLMEMDTISLDTDYIFAGVDHQANLKYLSLLVSHFNSIYNANLKVPELMFPDVKEMLIGVDGRKMSKSFNNTISILDSEEKIHYTLCETSMKVESSDMLKMAKHFIANKDEFDDLSNLVKNNQISLLELKEKLFYAINMELTPIRKKYFEYRNNIDYLDKVLSDGLEKVEKKKDVRIRTILGNAGIYQ